MMRRAKAVTRLIWDAIREEPREPLAPPDSYPDAEIAAMLRDVGIAMIEVVQPTQLVRNRLHNIAVRYTSKEVRVVVLPTVLIIQIDDEHHQVDVTTRSNGQLDLAGHVDHIGWLAEGGAMTPADVVAALAEARTKRPRFGPVVTVLGYVLTTIGFGMIMNPTWASLWGHALLGLVVGAIVIGSQPFPALRAIVPTMAATAVTMLATWFVADAANDGLLRVIAPSLVALLPGLALTVGAMELADSAIIAGTARLVYGIVQLMLLVFGVSLGMAIAGRIDPQEPSPQLGPWSFYTAIVVVGIGLYIYLSGPPGSLWWLTAAVAVALLGQRWAEHVVSAAHAGAVGAALVVPFAALVANLKNAPPPMVMLLAAFWALVPGGLTFESVSQAATSGDVDIATMATTIAAILSIALGTLVSWSVLETVAGAVRQRRADKV